MASASWQEELRLRLVERNRKESAYAGIIEQYRRLAQQTRLLKERNQALLRAVGSSGGNKNLSASTASNPGASDSAGGPSEYISSLLSEISSLRDEVAAVYRTQSQNAQRLLSMTETLRDKEEMLRIESDQLRKAREELATLKRKIEQHDELMAEKDRGIQVLHDEIQSLNLELNQVTIRNEALKVDNASLLQRWIDHQNDAAAKMNSANSFYEDMRKKGWNDAHGGRPSHGRRNSLGSSSEVSAGSEVETMSEAEPDDDEKFGGGGRLNGDKTEVQDPFLSLQNQPPQRNSGPRLNPNG
ncbi:ATG16-domain-containing protein [Clavulina sp. PMI_390]|nr:ATG16-domain-containing protein [Clavulina sp. PMI_390]